MTETLRVLERSDALFREHWTRPRVIRHKGVIDLVTETDVAVENFLKQNLKDVEPSASFSKVREAIVPSSLLASNA